MSVEIDYRSDLYRALHFVSSVKKLSGGIVRNISEIYLGSTLIWPKDRGVDPCMICCAWKDTLPSSPFDVTKADGLNSIAEWASEPSLMQDDPAATNCAYMLDHYYGTDLAVAEPYTGKSYNMWTAGGLHTVLGYFGRIYLNTNEIFELYGDYDTSLFFRIEDVEGRSPTQIQFSGGGEHTVSYTAERTGWHNFQLLVGNSDGAAGPSGGSVLEPSGEGIRFYLTIADTKYGPFRLGNIDSASVRPVGVRIDFPTTWGATHTISCDVNPERSGEVTGTGVYLHGSVYTLASLAYARYVFDYWSIGETTITTPTVSGVVTDDLAYTAHFARLYDVTANIDDVTHGTVTGGGTYKAGTSYTLSASSSAGWEFSYWDPSDGSAHITDATFTRTASKDISYTARYSIAVKTVTFALNGGNIGGSTADVVRSVNYGTVYTSIPKPSNPTKADHDFTGWGDPTPATAINENGQVVDNCVSTAQYNPRYISRDYFTMLAPFGKEETKRRDRTAAGPVGGDRTFTAEENGYSDMIGLVAGNAYEITIDDGHMCLPGSTEATVIDDGYCVQFITCSDAAMTTPVNINIIDTKGGPEISGYLGVSACLVSHNTHRGTDAYSSWPQKSSWQKEMNWHYCATGEAYIREGEKSDYPEVGGAKLVFRTEKLAQNVYLKLILWPVGDVYANARWTVTKLS